MKGHKIVVKESKHTLYKERNALHQKTILIAEGFEWIDHGDHENSVISYIRKGDREKENLVIVLNLTQTPQKNYRIGLPKNGTLKEIFNSDASKYNGTGNFTNTTLTSDRKTWNNRENSVVLELPPLGMVAFKYE